MLASNPARVVFAPISGPGHRPLQSLTALQEQVFPAQNVDPGVQDGVK